MEHIVKSQKRIAVEDNAMAYLSKTFKLTYGKEFPVISTSPIIEAKAGPKYQPYPGCFILNPGYTWDACNNPDGVVPVIVHKELVEGKGQLGHLKEEQKEGVSFLWNNFGEKKGGILAHGTGTGKTRTGVTFIVTLFEQSHGSKATSKPGIQKCLILAPKNGVLVWEQEFTKWCPSNILYNLELIRPGQSDGWDIVDKFLSGGPTPKVLILSYESFQKYNSLYGDRGFARNDLPNETVDIVICDEAHVLKNSHTNRFKNLEKFQSKAKVWIGFTATPFQNNLEEVCNLVNFFSKGSVFMGVDYKGTYCKRLKGALSGTVNHHRDSVTMDLLISLCNLIRPTMHFKSTYLPIERHVVTICIPLDGHPTHYSDDDEGQVEYKVQHHMYKMICSIFHTNPGCAHFYQKLHILSKLLISPKLCVEKALIYHPALQTVVDFYYSRFGNVNFGVMKEFEGLLSSKIRAVTTMALKLHETYPNEKMVIVSSSTTELRLVKVMLGSMGVVIYDGDKSESERIKCLQDFDYDDGVQFLLLSLKAGGTALTLTRANHLVLLDPDYNPANDMQALGRIDRLGQHRPIYIYRLLSTGTMEEAKSVLQLTKEELEKCVKAMNGNDLQTPFRQVDFLEYYDETSSHIHDVIDAIDLETAEQFDSTFADELKGAIGYMNNEDVPENLPLVKDLWPKVPISFVFYNATIPDLSCATLATELNPAVVEQNINLQNENQ